MSEPGQRTTANRLSSLATGRGSDFDPSTVPIRPAATVMLIRDRASSGALEVFMMRRTLQAVFAGGMYVFPGGRLDAVDGGSEMEAICDGLSDVEASALLQIDTGGLAYWVAAIRECFEEAGVLLARTAATGEYVRFDDDNEAARFTADREWVHDGSLGMIELCAREGLRLATDRMFYTAHWITPAGEARRFDTRFFVARAPQAQEPLHDDGETIASAWLTPQEALDGERSGEYVMLPPTIASLRFLGQSATADEALAAAAQIGVPPMILPKLRGNSSNGDLDLVMPDDPEYDSL